MLACPKKTPEPSPEVGAAEISVGEVGEAQPTAAKINTAEVSVAFQVSPQVFFVHTAEDSRPLIAPVPAVAR